MIFPRSIRYCRAVAMGSLVIALQVSHAQSSGSYKIRSDEPQQVIKGLGFEIQNDSIGSLNQGMPDSVVAVPHDLTPSERKRFYKQMLHGFRYSRLALGLYLRGLDVDQKHIVERYPGQMKDLLTMQAASGIEGFDVEYWSPPPFWKDSKSYYGGTVAAHDAAFFDAFSDALLQDAHYLQEYGLRVMQWGLQNEPVFGMDSLDGEKTVNGVRPKMPYAVMFYNPRDYAATLKRVAPRLHEAFPGIQIHANSWDGPSGEYAAEVRRDPALLRQVDAWTWHQVGGNSNDEITMQEKFLRGADGKPVYSNEFEYQPRDLKTISDPFMNTGQSLMNWMVFENSPTWYWLHALKPATNAEAAGYALGLWQPLAAERKFKPKLAPGHWEFNAQNWNAIAGFLRYLPWDSTRLTVDESTVEHDQRILVWRSKQDKIGMALSNRGKSAYTFRISAERTLLLKGHRYTIDTTNKSLGHASGQEISIVVPPRCYEFWIER